MSRYFGFESIVSKVRSEGAFVPAACALHHQPTKSKLSMSEGATKNPGVSYAPEIGIKRKNKEPKGTFKNLQDRGLKITNYSEKGWRKTTYD